MVITTLLIFLLDWISKNTYYDSSVFNSKIIELNTEEFERIACKGKCPVLALFQENEGIYLRKMDLENLCNQSVLLHEIIHSLQNLKEIKIENAFKEKEAYEIQNYFLSDISKKRDYLDILSVKKCRSQQTNELE